MEQQVIFRDYQEAQTADFNNLQAFTRQSFDDLVSDAVTASLRYSGFNTVQSNTAEITVAPGRFYGANQAQEVGAVFTEPNQTIISMVPYLAVSATRYCVLAVSGSEDQVNVETRDFLVNTTTLQTEPQAVAMTDSRDAVLTIVAGAEGATPTQPTVATNQVPIALILMSPTGVSSVEMLTGQQVISTEALNTRLTIVETFDTQIGPRVANLAADLAALANEIGGSLGNNATLVSMMQDIADLKAQANLPNSYSQYGAFYFLWPDTTAYDINNTLSLGFNALIDMGIRFPAQNADTFALSMFNPIDPNASYNSGAGLLLPAFTSVLSLQTGAVTTSVAMGQYTYQTFGYQEITIPYMQLSAGPSYGLCSNGAWWQSAGPANTPAYYLQNYQQYQLSDVTVAGGADGTHGGEYVQNYWLDTWTENYWVLDEVDSTIQGALVAQSFLVSSDTWITEIGIYISAVASATAINVQLCQCTTGQPDLQKVMFTGQLAGNVLKVGWNILTIVPTFVPSGTRCAVVLTTAANHQMGMCQAGSYLEGTFFYSLDGSYFLGDFSKEMALQIYTAQFTTNQVAIQLNSLNLQGGIRNIVLTARAQIPASCELVWEVLPDGTGTWLPITVDSPLVPFANAPVLCQFRARFVGTTNIMPGVVLPDSICKIWAPGPNFTFVSLTQTLGAPSNDISWKVDLQQFNTTAHSLTAKLYGAVGAFGNILFGGNPSNTNTLTLNGTAVTFVTGTPSGNQVQIAGSLQSTLTALITFLNASADAQISKVTWTADSTKLYGTFDTAGTSGNGYTLATTVAGSTVSNSGVLAGGSTSAEIDPSATTTTLTDPSDGSYTKQFSFTGMDKISSFVIVLIGTTNAISDPYLVSDITWWAL